MPLIFKKAPIISKTNTAYLSPSNWDDFSYKSLFNLIVFDGDGRRHDIGSVKIGYKKQKTGWTQDEVSDEFPKLKEGFFSLGQDDDYYLNIQKLEKSIRHNILTSLADVVHNEDLLNSALEHDVMRTSLLREVSLSSVKGQYSRILKGGSKLTEFHFEYEIPQTKRTAGMSMDFHVDPDSNPPTNVHVLIGRNGVGKTHLLNNMVKTLIENDETRNTAGIFKIHDNIFGSPDSSKSINELFGGVVSVAFSAFDPFEPYPEQKDKTKGLRYSYVGLKRATNVGGKKGTPMSWEMLTKEFVNSLLALIEKGKLRRWVKAIKNLESDILFREISLSRLFPDTDDEELEALARKIFKKLSSGHAIVLLTITKLVEKIEEKTLVLLDEPEAHLHPPLLSAFVRTLSDLLSHRNAVAIIATHSPVILQEVPSDCVWKLRRTGLQANAERPEIETFGENVGILTREVFSLEVTESGYHQLLQKELEETNSYRKILRSFDGQLGTEARGILRGLLIAKETEED